MSADLETLTPDTGAELDDADALAAETESDAAETALDDDLTTPEPDSDLDTGALVDDVEMAELAAEVDSAVAEVAEAETAGAEAETTDVATPVVPPSAGDASDSPGRRRRWPWVVAVVLVFALVLTGGAFAGATVSYANAHEGRLLPGTRINGIAVGGLTRAEALREVRASLRQDLRRTVTVQYGDQSWKARARSLGVRSNVQAVVADVAASQENVSWRQWAGLRWMGEEATSSADVKLSYRRKPVAAFVEGIAAAVERKPRDATLNVVAGGISITPHEVGRDVRTGAVTRDLMAALRGDNRPVPLAVDSVAPEVRTAAYKQVLLLDQSDHVLTLYLDGESVRSWIVAVGTGDYPTPLGRYEISLKRYMPTWVNPDPEGWGKDMPEMIPPGENNPLGVRALNWSAPGAIRFHGTQAIDSLGTDASHGCVRMSNDDVSELYDLVDEGAVIISQS